MEIPQTHWEYAKRSPVLSGLVALVEAYAFTPSTAKKIEELLAESHPTLLNQAIAASRWLTSGKAHFVLSPSIQKAFNATTLDRIPVEAVALPFRALWISFPRTPRLLWNESSGRHSLRGCYLAAVEANYTGQTNDLLISLWGPPGSRHANAGDDAIFNFRVKLGEVPPGTSFEEYFRQYLLSADWKHDQSTEEWLTGEKRQRWSTEGQTINQETALWVVRQTLNMLFYLQTPRADVVRHDGEAVYNKAVAAAEKKKNPTKREKALQAAEKLPRTSVTIIGKNYSPKVSGPSGGPTSLSVRPHWRRGHFHRYWVGPRKDQEGNFQPGTHQETHWIEPVWVGSGEPGESPNLYYVV